MHTHTPHTRTHTSPHHHPPHTPLTTPTPHIHNLPHTHTTVTPSEVREQIDVLTVQAKQKGEEMPDEARAKDEIENALLRKKVFDLLAGHATITWVDAVPEEGAPPAQE